MSSQTVLKFSFMMTEIIGMEFLVNSSSKTVPTKQSKAYLNEEPAIETVTEGSVMYIHHKLALYIQVKIRNITLNMATVFTELFHHRLS